MTALQALVQSGLGGDEPERLIRGCRVQFNKAFVLDPFAELPDGPTVVEVTVPQCAVVMATSSLGARHA